MKTLSLNAVAKELHDTFEYISRQEAIDYMRMKYGIQVRVNTICDAYLTISKFHNSTLTKTTLK